MTTSVLSNEQIDEAEDLGAGLRQHIFGEIDPVLHPALQCLADRRYIDTYSFCHAGSISTAILNTKGGHYKGCGFPIEHVLIKHQLGEECIQVISNLRLTLMKPEKNQAPDAKPS